MLSTSRSLWIFLAGMIVLGGVSLSAGGPVAAATLCSTDTQVCPGRTPDAVLELVRVPAKEVNGEIPACASSNIMKVVKIHPAGGGELSLDPNETVAVVKVGQFFCLHHGDIIEQTNAPIANFSWHVVAFWWSDQLRPHFFGWVDQDRFRPFDRNDLRSDTLMSAIQAVSASRDFCEAWWGGLATNCSNEGACAAARYTGADKMRWVVWLLFVVAICIVIRRRRTTVQQPSTQQ